jgi:pimeloyl-ACP methyl ester carboxylesterase
VCPMMDLPARGPDEEEDPDVPASLSDRSVLAFDGRVTRISAEGAAVTFYGDCDPADVDWAVSQLRPQGRAPATPLVAPWPDVPSSLILGTEDRARNPEYLRRVTAPRLGVTPIELPGDHSPFLSRPGELAAVLDELATAG